MVILFAIVVVIPSSQFAFAVPNPLSETYHVTSDESITNLTIESGGELIIDSGATLSITGILTIQNGGKLIVENNGTIIFNGTTINNGIINYGVIEQYGLIDYVNHLAALKVNQGSWIIFCGTIGNGPPPQGNPISFQCNDVIILPVTEITGVYDIKKELGDPNGKTIVIEKNLLISGTLINPYFIQNFAQITLKNGGSINLPSGILETICENSPIRGISGVGNIIPSKNYKKIQCDPPKANPDSVMTLEDTSVVVNVLVNDMPGNNPSIPRNDPTLSVKSFQAPKNGTLIKNIDNTFSYSPKLNYFGIDSFKYTISDGNGVTSTATVTITITPVSDDPPVAKNDSVTTPEDNSVTIDVLANDNDPDGDPITIISTTNGIHGVTSTNGLTVTYSPNPNYFGTDSFTYTISDNKSGTSTATVTITITPVNDAPVAKNDSDTVSEGGSTVTDLANNDSDVDDELDLTSINIITQPANGILTVNNDGTVGYAHDGSETVTDSYTYTINDLAGATSNTATVTITITPVNDAPVAKNDSDTVSEDSIDNAIDVLANDVDPDGDILSIVSVQSFDNGGLGIINDNGTPTITDDDFVSYTPNVGFSGTETFTYTISDGILSDTATVAITIVPANSPPIAVDDSVTTPEDTSVTIDVLANDIDPDGDPLSITDVTDGDHGTTTDGSTVTYSPNLNYNGPDFFTYTISDGIFSDTATVTITITPVNDAPVAKNDSDTVSEGGSTVTDLANNDSDVDDELDLTSINIITQPANGILTVNNDGTVGYAHDGSETVTDSYTYTINDLAGATSNTATVTITITPVNDAPVAKNDSDTVSEGGSTVTDLANNDSDVDDELDLTSINIITQPANGILTVNNDGTVGYAHDGSETVTDSYTYTINDLAGATSNTATVTITITPVNDAPVCTNASSSISTIWPPNHKMVTFDYSMDTTDAENDTITLSIFSIFQDEPTNGISNDDKSPDADLQNNKIRAESSGNGDGRVYVITILASDGHGGSCTGSFTIDVPHNIKSASVNSGAIYDSTK
ncbi:MAG: tandem-95 repeat protein [Nitrosopumilus sp.]|uniref:Ig-like domain-containing protein n=1 Tax=Nitrosopumilus sp. TaxID=2024843 RepID=UPI00247D6BC6|nr:Ig-like domain-containing protein [Nitrosopumilus sp.]MCV0393253.1 tandem-95 repeat protein [Nitrosopumilus sp.]